MKLLLVGSASKYAIEKHYLHYFAQQPEVSSVSLFAAQNKFLEYYHKSIFHKILYRTGLSKVLSRINEELKNTIRESRPDVVFVFKGMEIFPTTLRWMRREGIRLVNYNPDNPFVFTGKGSGNENVTQSIGLYDLHFTYDEKIKAQLETQFQLPVQILPFGYELSEIVYDECAAQKEEVKVCFLGNPDNERAQFILTLANADVPLDVYGHGWHNVIKHPNITIHDSVYDDEFWMVLSRYRVQLNLMRVHNPNSHNMRSFEIPAVGGIQLAPNTPDHRTFFQPDKEIFLYWNTKDCVTQLRRILALSTNDCKEIRMAARMRSVTSHYSYRDRTNQVVADIKTLF